MKKPAIGLLYRHPFDGQVGVIVSVCPKGMWFDVWFCYSVDLPTTFRDVSGIFGVMKGVKS